MYLVRFRSVQGSLALKYAWISWAINCGLGGRLCPKSIQNLVLQKTAPCRVSWSMESHARGKGAGAFLCAFPCRPTEHSPILESRPRWRARWHRREHAAFMFCSSFSWAVRLWVHWRRSTGVQHHRFLESGTGLGRSPVSK